MTIIPICDKHKTPMLPSKSGDGFWFCPQKEENGEYCRFMVAPSPENKIADVNKIRDERIGVAGLLQAKLGAKLIKIIDKETIRQTLEETRLIKRIVEDNQ